MRRRVIGGGRRDNLCRKFGIPRKTGYTIFNRYKTDGLEALNQRSRRPVRYARP
ncbi:helix-turn-helix domain-containing protein [Pararhizobium sp. PWRC1-1]|uniref:helix-turn-helix domain-containing protein n=1 Tax=Pararhizobium sp. PWRC1-1 TaxID=2804566 RepID=UPI003CF2501F